MNCLIRRESAVKELSTYCTVLVISHWQSHCWEFYCPFTPIRYTNKVKIQNECLSVYWPRLSNLFFWEHGIEIQCQCNLRLLDTYASEIAKISVLWTFWTVIQLINHLFVRFRTGGLLAELRARMSRGRRFLLFLKHTCLVTLMVAPIQAEFLYR